MRGIIALKRWFERSSCVLWNIVYLYYFVNTFSLCFIYVQVNLCIVRLCLFFLGIDIWAISSTSPPCCHAYKCTYMYICTFMAMKKVTGFYMQFIYFFFEVPLAKLSNNVWYFSLGGSETRILMMSFQSLKKYVQNSFKTVGVMNVILPRLWMTWHIWLNINNSSKLKPVWMWQLCFMYKL